MKKLITITSLALALVRLQAAPVNLNFVYVSAPPINCVFDPSCSIVVNDSTSPILFPGWPSNAPFFLQSRTFAGKPGSPAAGLYGYEYRADLTIPPGFSGPSDECLFSITIDFGPIVPMNFDGSGTLNPVYVITEGALGSLAPTAVLQDGSQVSFVFAEEGDTGLISQLCLGGSSFFVGLVSTQPPTGTTAVLDTNGFAQMGIPPESVAARAPRSNPFLLLIDTFRLAEEFPLLDWIGADRRLRETHRKITLDLLEDAQDLVDLGENDSAGDLLRILLNKVNGQPGNWLQNNPNSGINAETLLYENLATTINVLQPGSPVPVVPPPTSRPPGT